MPNGTFPDVSDLSWNPKLKTNDMHPVFKREVLQLAEHGQILSSAP